MSSWVKKKMLLLVSYDSRHHSKHHLSSRLLVQVTQGARFTSTVKLFKRKSTGHFRISACIVYYFRIKPAQKQKACMNSVLVVYILRNMTELQPYSPRHNSSVSNPVEQRCSIDDCEMMPRCHGINLTVKLCHSLDLISSSGAD